MAGRQATESDSRLRLRLTFNIAIVGVGATLAAFIVAVIVFQDADDPGETIAAVIGAVTTAIGTLAGLVAGHTAGASGKEKAEERADSSDRTVMALLDVSPPNILDQARSRYPDLFGGR